MSIKEILRRNDGLLKLYKNLREHVFALDPRKFRYSKYGLYLTGNPADYTYRATIDADDGFQVTALIDQLSHEDRVFLDIGANIGAFSVYAAKKLKSGHVFAFEPNYFIFKYLIENIEKNRVSNITPICCAVGDTPLNFKQFYYQETHTGKGSFSEKSSSKIHIIAFNRAVFDALPIATAQKVFVKVDVEGFEMPVVEELFQSVLASRIDYLVLEMLPRHQEKNERLHAFLETRNFHVDASFNHDHRNHDVVYKRS